MEPKGNSIKLSTFLKYGLTEVKRCSIVNVWLGSKYASVNILYKVLPREKQNLKCACKRKVL